jgi:hypothetical protein
MHERLRLEVVWHVPRPMRRSAVACDRSLAVIGEDDESLTHKFRWRVAFPLGQQLRRGWLTIVGGEDRRQRRKSRAVSSGRMRRTLL